MLIKYPDADLDKFSMFGQTGDPQKCTLMYLTSPETYRQQRDIYDL